MKILKSNPFCVSLCLRWQLILYKQRIATEDAEYTESRIRIFLLKLILLM
jgi:hypothetical protein